MQPSRPYRYQLPGALIVSMLACQHTPAPPHPDESSGTPPIADARAESTVVATPVDAGSPSAAANTPVLRPILASPDEDAPCTLTPHVTIAPGWRLRGFEPGPAFREIFTLRRHRLAARSARRLCTSDDDGAHWTERLALESPQSALDVQALDRHGSFVAIAKASDADPADARVTQLFVSHDPDAESWSPVTLPSSHDPLRAAFTDGLGRLYATSTHELFESDDAGVHWQGPRTLPGREARETAACGPIVIAHARLDDDWFYHRSFDHGATWRPFRLGVIGLDGDRSVLRCITEHGGIEAGRPPVPTAWSWDGGLHWAPGAYDTDALHIAHAALEPGALPAGESPHCHAGPGRFVECVDTGRSRLVTTRGVMRTEVHAPSLCEHVRQLDERRTLAFGPGCGLFLSADRGGRWRMHSQSLASRRSGTFAEGRGGFVSADVAWRLDGGIWWTFDGGEHWQPFFSIHARLLDRGVFVDRRNGVFATNTGWIVATHDGGHTFTFILRGEIERVSSSRRAVIVTTAQSVRLSPDGGRAWLAAGTPAPATPLDPTVEIVGRRRSITIAAGVTLVQDDTGLHLGENDNAPTLLAGLPPGYHLLAAHATAGHIDRILLEGGAVLARD